MGIIVDVALLSVFVLSIFVGVKNGFVRSILGLVAAVIAVAAAVALSAPVAQSVYDAFFEERIVAAIAAELPDVSAAQSVAQQTQEIISSIPDYIASAAESIGVDISAIARQAAEVDLSAENIALELTQSIAQPIAVSILRVIAFALIFIIAYALLQIAVAAVSGLFKLPVLKTVNKWLGAAFGAVKGIVWVVVFALLLNAVTLLFDGGDFASAVGDSTIVDIISSAKLFTA